VPALIISNITIPFYKRLFSYIYPVSVRRGRGQYNQYLEVLLYCNRFQLITSDALYSDGDKYRPARETVNSLKSFLPEIRNVLVLGTGLASMVRVLRSKGCNPKFTLVELDKSVLSLALEFLEEEQPGMLTPICGDAMVFMQHNTSRYDLIFIDVFNGRVVPEFVCTEAFMEQCRAGLAQGGHVAFNYIINDEDGWAMVKELFTRIFPDNIILSIGINRIMIGRVA
jgi:spermidine synthase